MIETPQEKQIKLQYYRQCYSTDNNLNKKGKEENEYPISKNIKRVNINSRSGDLLKIIKREKIDILIYHFYYHVEMKSLNKLRNTKIIYYNHSCFLIWIYALFFHYFQTTYEVYRKSKYIISLVPFESDYLLKKWGINSILMRNYITYEYIHLYLLFS